MRSSVAAGWRKFIEPYEGYCTWIYWDTHSPSLPTTGVGNLMGSDIALSSFGKSLPFRIAGPGSYATEAEIWAEAVRLRNLKLKGSGAVYEKHAHLFLDDAVVEQIVFDKLNEIAEDLLYTFPKFDSWPANAQLAVLNMAWLMGPYFAENNKWPKFTAAINAGKFAEAADECADKDGWDKERNRRNRDNLRWAGIVAANVMDPSILRTSAPVLPAAAPVTGHVSIRGVKHALDGAVNSNGRVLQNALKVLRLYNGPIDGDCGKMTQAALAAWFKQKKISTDTEVKTWLPVLMKVTIKFSVTD